MPAALLFVVLLLFPTFSEKGPTIPTVFVRNEKGY